MKVKRPLSSFFIIIFLIVNVFNVSPCIYAEADDSVSFSISTEQDLKDAINAIEGSDNDTFILQLLQDISLTEGISITKGKITLLGNGHTITAYNSGYMFTVTNGARVFLGEAGNSESSAITLLSGTSPEGFIHLTSGGAATLYNGVTVDGNGKNTSGAISVEAGSVFNMKGGIIMGSRKAKQGGGVSLIGSATEDAAFIMEDGIIQDNSASAYGGGVYANHSVFSMKGGVIQNNTAYNGGGGVYGEWSVLTIEAGTIQQNKATSPRGFGGGVYNIFCTYFTLGGGSVKENSAAYGGGIFSANSTVTLTDGVIENNRASAYGGGVFASRAQLMGTAWSDHVPATTVGSNVNDGSYQFYMAGSTIKNNTASFGGGVCLQEEYNGHNPSELMLSRMSGGEIMYNNAQIGGGLIAIRINPMGGGSRFDMTGGSIHNNSASAYADDIYSQYVAMTLIGADDFGSLSATGKTIDAWHHDGTYLHHETDEPLRWSHEGDEPYVDKAPHQIEDHEVMSLKAAHGMSVTVTYHLKGGTWTDEDNRFEAIDNGTYMEFLPKGENTTPPTAPIKDGYTFTGWYIDSDCLSENPYSFESPVNEDISLYAGYTELPIFVIQPKSITGYVGGVSASGNAAPTLRFQASLLRENTLTPITSLRDWELTMYLEGDKTATGHEGETCRKMKPEKTGGSMDSYYLFPTLELGLTAGKLKGDFIAFEKKDELSTLAGSYMISLMDDKLWHIWARNSDDGLKYRVAVYPGEANVTSRYVHNEADIYTAPSSMLSKIVKSEQEVNTLPVDDEGIQHRKVVAVIPEDATFYTNGASSGLGITGAFGHGYLEEDGANQPLIALLFDETVSLSSEVDDKKIESLMIEHASHNQNVGGDENFSFADWNYRFRYLDLVNVNDGNAWVTCDKDITVYWPYPEEILEKLNKGISLWEALEGYQFQILHYKGMEREYSSRLHNHADIWGEAIMHSIGNEVTVEGMLLDATPRGLSFILPADKEGHNMSPFVLMWRYDEPATISDPEDPDESEPTVTPTPAPTEAPTEAPTVTPPEPKPESPKPSKTPLEERSESSDDKTAAVATDITEGNSRPASQTTNATPTGDGTKTAGFALLLLLSIISLFLIRNRQDKA